MLLRRTAVLLALLACPAGARAQQCDHDCPPAERDARGCCPPRVVAPPPVTLPTPPPGTRSRERLSQALAADVVEPILDEAVRQTRECGRLGTADYDVTIVVEGRSGHVVDVRATSTPSRGPGMDGCVSEAFRHVVLPRFRARTQSFTRTLRVAPPLPDRPPNDAVGVLIARGRERAGQCRQYGSGPQRVTVTLLGATGAVDDVALDVQAAGGVSPQATNVPLIACLGGAFRDLHVPIFTRERFDVTATVDLGPADPELPTPPGDDELWPIINAASVRAVGECRGSAPLSYRARIDVVGATGRVREVRLERIRGPAEVSACVERVLSGATFPRARVDYSSPRIGPNEVAARTPELFAYDGSDAAWIEVQNAYPSTQYVYLVSPGPAGPRFLATLQTGAAACIPLPPGRQRLVSADSPNPTDNPVSEEIEVAPGSSRRWLVYRRHAGTPPPEFRSRLGTCSAGVVGSTRDGTSDAPTDDSSTVELSPAYLGLHFAPVLFAGTLAEADTVGGWGFGMDLNIGLFGAMIRGVYLNSWGDDFPPAPSSRVSTSSKFFWIEGAACLFPVRSRYVWFEGCLGGAAGFLKTVLTIDGDDTRATPSVPMPTVQVQLRVRPVDFLYIGLRAWGGYAGSAGRVPVERTLVRGVGYVSGSDGIYPVAATLELTFGVQFGLGESN